MSEIEMQKWLNAIRMNLGFDPREVVQHALGKGWIRYPAFHVAEPAEASSD